MADDILSYLETIGEANDIDIRSDFAYVADGIFDNDIKVIDISDLSAPVGVGKIHVPDAAMDLEIAGEYLFLAGGNAGFNIIKLY